MDKERVKLNNLLTLSDEDLYAHYNESEPEMASEAVRRTYKELGGALEEYIAAVSENSFANGFRYANSLIEERTGV